MDNKLINKRIDWLDALKRFATILVVVGHCFFGYINANMFPYDMGLMKTMTKEIYSFHMPLFFILSGYAFMLSGTYKKWKKRAYEVFSLYWIWSIIQFVVKFKMGNMVNMPVGINDFIALIYKPLPPYWYLYDLFFFVIILSLLLKYNIGIYKILGGVFFISLFSILSPVNLGELGRCMYNLFFFSLGCVIFNIGASKMQSGVKASMILAVIGLLLHIFFEEKIIWPASISLTLFAVFMKTKAISQNKLLNQIGIYCLPIYVIHCFITAAFRIIYKHLGLVNMWPCFIVSLIFGILIPIAIYKLGRRNKFLRFCFHPNNV